MQTPAERKMRDLLIDEYWFDIDQVNKMSYRDLAIYYNLLTRVREVTSLDKGYSKPVPLHVIADLISERKLWLHEADIVFCNSVKAFGYSYKNIKRPNIAMVEE